MITATASLAAAQTHAGGRFLLSLDGEPSAIASFDDGAARGQATLGVEVEELTSPELRLVDQLVGGIVAPHAFALEGPAGKQKGSLSLGAVRLPPIGVGGNGITRLTFTTEHVTRSPFALASASEKKGSAGRRLGAVRAEIDGVPTPIVGVDAIALREKGTAALARVEGEVGVTVPTTELGVFAKWARGGAGASRALVLEYLDADQRRVLGFELVGCRPRATKPSGSPTTRVVLDCPSVKRSTRS